MESYVVPGLKEAATLAINDNYWTPVRTLLEITIAKDSVEYKQLQQIHVNDNLIKEACSKGFTELVNVFLNSGFPVNCIVDKSTDRRMLYLAASTGHLSLVKLLLNAGADIDCKTGYGETPLFVAVYKDYLEVVKYLINAGAYINTCNIDGTTLLEAALCYRKYNVAEKMLQLLSDSECNAKSYNSLLFGAIEGNNKINLVQMLLDSGAHVNGTDDIPLHRAAWYGDIPLMKLLLDYGADINAKNELGYTALHEVVKSKELQSVEFLIEHGSLINSVNNDKETPLSLSIIFRQFDITRLLMSKGADLNLPIYDTVLHTAVSVSSPIHVIEYLLEHGANVTTVDCNKTALQHVISYSDYSSDEKLHVAKLLLIYGSDHYVEYCGGSTLLHWACRMRDVELVEYLIDYGLDVDAKNRQGMKPIDIAHTTRHPVIVNIIIEYHCNKYSSF